MHESTYRSAAADLMRRRWPGHFFIEESYTPYGTQEIGDRRGFPDILRISPTGKISIVEVKKWEHADFEKWKLLGQIQFYTFLIETQYLQDNQDFLWMGRLITKGLFSQRTVNAIENRIKKKQNIVLDWVVVVVGGSKREIEKDESVWRMHDYVNFGLKSNKHFRPLTLLHLKESKSGFTLSVLENCYRK